MGDNIIISMKPKIKGLMPKNYVAIPTAWVQYGPPQPVKWDKPSGEDIMHFFGFFRVAPGLKLQKAKGVSMKDGVKMVDYAKTMKSEFCMPTWDKEDDMQGGVGARTEYNGEHWANEHGGAVKKVHEALLKDPYALNTCTKQWFGKGVANCVKSCLSRLGEEKLRQYIGMPDLKKATFGDMSRTGIPWARYHYHFDGKGWLVADETTSPVGKPKFLPVDKWAASMSEGYMNENAQSLDYFDERDQEARAISEMQTPLLNKFARQQRLNPKYAHPALRGMMEAVAQVYETKEELQENEEELLNESVPGAVKKYYVKFLETSDNRKEKRSYRKGAVEDVANIHKSLNLAFYTLDFHWDNNRPWKATDKGKKMHDKFMKVIKKASSNPGYIENGNLNDTKQHAGDIWNMIFNNPDNIKKWGIEQTGTQIGGDQWSGEWTSHMYTIPVEPYFNPYGDFGDPITKGKGFYLDMAKKMGLVIEAEPKDK